MENAVLQKALLAAAGKCRVIELDASNSGDLLIPATSRRNKGQGNFIAKGTVAKSTICTCEQTARSGRQISYAEVSATYAGVVFGRPEKQVNARVDASVLYPIKRSLWKVQRRDRNEGDPRNVRDIQDLERKELRHGGKSRWRTLWLSACYTKHCLENVSPESSSLNVPAAEVTTLKNSIAAGNEVALTKTVPEDCSRKLATLRACMRQNQLHWRHPKNKGNWAVDGITLFEGSS